MHVMYNHGTLFRKYQSPKYSMVAKPNTAQHACAVSFSYTGIHRAMSAWPGSRLFSYIVGGYSIPYMYSKR